MPNEDRELERELEALYKSSNPEARPAGPKLVPPPVRQPVQRESPIPQYEATPETEGPDVSEAREHPPEPPSPPRPAPPKEDPSAQPQAGKLAPFESKETTKLGILGGRGTGKSYLFRAIVRRLYVPKRAGALAYYQPKLNLMEASSIGKEMRKSEPVEFLRPYQTWERLNPTTIDDTRWYRMQIDYRAGLLAKGSRLEVDLVDGPGEFLEGTLGQESLPIWEHAFAKASIMIFCLPIWAAFPGPLSQADEELRLRYLRGFAGILRNYGDIRDDSVDVKCILALTMADDHRSALRTLKSRWIDPYVGSKNQKRVLDELRNPRRITRYLQNAQEVSAYLHREFDTSKWTEIQGIPGRLEFGKGKPWILPLTAVDGSRLALRDSSGGEPTPAHVELPLLVAMCEKLNALM